MNDQLDGHEADCAICELVAARSGVTLFEDRHWVVGMLEGLEIPGWIVLAQRRHAVGAAAMNEAEAASLGPLLKRAATAIETVTAAERVYVVGYGENAPHWHMLLMARGSDHPIEQRQAAIWGHREEYLDPALAHSVAAELRTALADDSAEPSDPAIAR